MGYRKEAKTKLYPKPWVVAIGETRELRRKVMALKVGTGCLVRLVETCLNEFPSSRSWTNSFFSPNTTVNEIIRTLFNEVPIHVNTEEKSTRFSSRD